ncbi:hypothetical protein SRB5_39130 [Streptomyces sp. RB5]|uniref:Uncharacterized protein n=1 Tax=Streptomyces smaragdinus TaxID=2585196 RepID=A0A7K0CK38_9ACTN|nr:hypothetical protein [Streptomyces smaragdinus]MQY13761.1 hypothetical protein [Streptomyces smaragdinus]
MSLNLGHPAVTLGGVTLGTIIVALTVQRWWKKGGGKGGTPSWKELLPFVFALCYGMLAVLASPGVSFMGVVSRAGLWGGNQLGYGYLVWGLGGTSPGVTRASAVVLTPGGYAVYGIWTALLVGQHLWSKRMPRLQTAFGAVAGILLGLSAGIAGIAAVPLASAVNALGSWYAGVVQ